MSSSAPAQAAVTVTPARDRHRSRRVRIVVGVLVVLLGGGLATASWLGARSAPHAPGGGWWSADMEYATSAGLTESHQVFRCVPGTLESRIDLTNNGPVPITVTDVRVPMLDDILADGRALRTGTEMMRDPNGDDPYDLVDFDSAPVGGADWVRLVLTWEIRECPALAGYMIEDRLEVTYVALGMTHTVTIDQVAPMALTGLPLDELP